MELTKIKSLIVLIGLYAHYAQSQVPPTKICSWSEIRAASIRGALYLDGGLMWKSYPDVQTWLYTGNTTSPPQSILYTLNYSTPFDITKSNLTDLFTQVDEGGQKLVTPMYNGYMFADEDEFYTFGGIDSPSVIDTDIPPPNYAFGWQIYEGTPGVTNPELGATPWKLPAGISRYTTNGAGANVPSESLAFYFSGMTNTPGEYDGMGITGWIALDQLIEVDMTTFGSPQIYNYTIENSDVLARADAQLVWIPVGDRGTLIAIGGVVNPEELFKESLTSDQLTESQNISPEFMKTLPVYDIANKVWYTQETTGPYPGQLTQFCSVVVNQTQSSYEIFIYGGYDGLVGSGFEPTPPSGNVWVLSVPSFTWTQVYQGDGDDGRRGHICTAPYPDQMLVIGGEAIDEDCLSDSLVKVFNINKLEWQNTYDPTVYSPYQVPAKVAAAIKKQPTANWNNTAISDLFGRPYPGHIVTYYPYPSPPSHHSSNIAAIAGGAVAGTVCFIVLVLAILWYSRKQKEKKRLSSGTEVQPYEQVSRWRRNVAKTEPSVTTTEVDDTNAINPDTGGYYKPVEAPGDEAFHRQSPNSPRPGGFAEAGGGTRRISGGPTISPRSPRSPQSGTLGTHEAGGEERYEMEVMSSQRGSGDIGAKTNFRNHSLYPLSVSDGDGRSQASGPSYSGPSHSHSQTSRGESSRDVPSPYFAARPGNNNDIIEEMPASPVRPDRLQHTRNISSISSTFPQVSPPLEQRAQAATVHHAATTSEDDLDALERFHTSSPQPFRPAHARNLSSMSSGIAQLPTPQEELSEEEKHRQSKLLGQLASPVEGTTPSREERNPLLGGHGTAMGSEAAKADEDVYSPSNYSKGSTLASQRSPTSRKPVGQGLGISERAFQGNDGIGEPRQTL